ncbi:MAG: DUF3352 domain-containing protein [Chloroflexi bacterium]|nr:DUF3352 domain-containing protein [Chloroflexota bacterium]
MNRWAMLLLLALLLAALPAAAQDTAVAAANLVPADFAGFIRLQTSDPVFTLNSLNATLALASELQPARIQMTEALDFEAFIPFNTLFDVENVSFVDNVLPWLGDELVLAYRQFDAALQTTPDDTLLIVPSRDMFQTASRLRPVIEGQDLLERATYRDLTLYQGDKTTIAITPTLVLIGADALVRQALDVQAGEAEALTGTRVYQDIQAASPADTALFAYASGSRLPQAVAGIISGSAPAQPLFPALGAAIKNVRGTPGLDTRLLNGGFDGVGISLGFVPEQPKFAATVVFHSADSLEPTADLDLALLEFVPRTALLVQRGGSLTDFGQALLAALPLSSFSGPMLGGLPFNTVGGTSPLIPPPTADDVTAAVSSFFDSLTAVAGFNLQTDLLDRLTGGYVLALLPRPNDPLPALLLPFDALLVTPVNADEADTLTQNISRLLQLAFGVQPLPASAEQPSLTRLGSGTDTVFEMTVLDGLLVFGTGNAVELALGARRGDNRLIEQAAWQAITKEEAPGLYLDASILFNTFFPVAGGSVPGLNERIRLGVWSARPQRHLWQLRLEATLPTGQ